MVNAIPYRVHSGEDLQIVPVVGAWDVEARTVKRNSPQGPLWGIDLDRARLSRSNVDQAFAPRTS
jgi:hypothetical protein